MYKWMIIISLLFLSFNSCNHNTKKNRIESWLYVNLNKEEILLNDACLSCLSIMGVFTKNGSEYIAFLDYKPGVVYLYNKIEKKFESKFTIPNEANSSSPHVLKIYNVDSILYFNHTKHHLIFCDSSKIKFIKSEIGLHDQLDSNFVVSPVRSRLWEINKYFVFDIMPIHTKNTAPFYYDLKNANPFLGLFAKEDFNYHFVPIFDPFSESREKTLVNHLNIFEVDSRANVIYFQNQCMNNLYQYDLKTNKTSEINVVNSSFEITPIYFSYDPNNQNSYYEAMNNQNYCFDLYYYPKYQILLRHLSIIREQNRFHYLQIINRNYEVINELRLPDNYITEFQTKDDFILQRYEPKTKTIILEKLNFKL